MNNKIILILLSILFLFGCIASVSSNSGIQIRHTINNCETFDCSTLDKEITLLKKMINNNDINQGIQQNLVTTITKKCSEVKIKDIPCKRYVIERKRLYGNKYE